MMTVRAALRVDALQAGRPLVVAGAGHLDRPIRWVHAGEAANMPALLSGGELLLTTGLGMGATVGEHRRFVRALAEKGVSALAVELGPRLTQLSPAVIAEADTQGLPLIVIRQEVRFVEITEVIHREIVDRQMDVLRRGEDVQRRFTEMMLNGDGVPEVLQELARTVENPVVLERTDRGVAYSAAHRTCESTVLAHWNDVKDGTGATEAISLPVRTDAQEAWGRLWVLALDSQLGDLARVAIERATGLIALALLRAHQDDVLAVRRPSGFLTRVLAGGVDDRTARDVVGGLGFSRATAWLLPVVASLRSGVDPHSRAVFWGLMWRELHAELGRPHRPVIAGTLDVGHDFAIVIGVDDPDERTATVQRVARAIGIAAERQRPTGEVAIGAGSLAARWSELHRPLRDALNAAAVPHAPTAPGWRDAERADLVGLLWTLRDDADVRTFVERSLGPLIKHDRDRNPKLLPTLRTFFAHRGHKAAAARSLHIERQSLYHRLERIERLLGVGLDDEDTALGLHLALRALDELSGELRVQPSALHLVSAAG